MWPVLQKAVPLLHQENVLITPLFSWSAALHIFNQSRHCIGKKVILNLLQVGDKQALVGQSLHLVQGLDRSLCCFWFLDLTQFDSMVGGGSLSFLGKNIYWSRICYIYHLTSRIQVCQHCCMQGRSVCTMNMWANANHGDHLTLADHKGFVQGVHGKSHLLQLLGSSLQHSCRNYRNILHGHRRISITILEGQNRGHGGLWSRTQGIQCIYVDIHKQVLVTQHEFKQQI